MAIVRELLTRFSFSTDQSGINKVEGSINRLSGMLSGLAAFASLRALAGVADSMQSLEARIGMLPQTLGDVGDAFEEVAQRASNSRQGITAYATMYIRLAGATKEYLTTQEDVLLVTDAISNALIIGGAVASEQASAMLQLSQAFQKGKLDGDEFKSFMENLSSDFKDKLAVQLDTTVDKLYDLSSSGQLTAKKLAFAFKAMSSEIQIQMLKMPLTIGQATTIIGNKFSTMIAKLNRESQVVTKVANFLLDGFKSIENGAKEFIRFVGGSSNAIKAFGIALAAILGPMALGGLISILGVVFSMAGLVVVGLVLLGLAIDDIVTYLDGGQSVFGGFVQWLKDGSIGASALEAVMVTLSAAFAVWGVAAVSAWGSAAAAALAGGASMALAWVLAMGPMALVYAGIAAVSTAVFMLWNNWDTVMGWMGEKVKWVIDKAKALGQFFGIGTGAGPTTPNVAPSTVAKSAAAGGNTNVTSNQTVNLTVPPGTSESQQSFLKTSAGVLKGEGVDKKMARDLATGGW